MLLGSRLGVERRGRGDGAGADALGKEMARSQLRHQHLEALAPGGRGGSLQTGLLHPGPGRRQEPCAKVLHPGLGVQGSPQPQD